MSVVGPLVVGTQETGGSGRVGVAIGVSLVLHVGGMAGFLYLDAKRDKSVEVAISDVELHFEQEQQKAQPARARKRPPPASMKDFLKMALPSVRKTRSLAQIDRPKIERTLMEMPKAKLRDRGRMQNVPKMNLDLNKRRASMAKLNAQPLTQRRSSQLAALPKLEEVGTRRAAPKILAAAALEERQQGPRLAAIKSPLAATRRNAPQAAPLLGQEASPKKTLGSRLANLLPEKTSAINMASRRTVAPKRMEIKKTIAPPPTRAKPRQLAQVNKPKKAVEIEGPLRNRKVIAHSIPTFPGWLQDTGVIEADVAIKFFVNPEGRVVDGRMRVDRSSGYGRLDRLAMQHLKSWRFEPLALATGDQWGIITFRFLLE
jgi:TonB family protein